MSQNKNAILRPPFDPALGDPLAVVRLSAQPTLEMIRGPSVPADIDPILAEFPQLEHLERRIPRSDGSQDPPIVLSILRPKDSGKSALPLLYYIHGGGQIAGTRSGGFAPVIRHFVNAGVDAVFASVEYRLAPEYPAPAALNDCFDGLLWVVDQSAELGADPSKVVISGMSGGAPLAAGTAILARDKGQPKLLAQMLMCPMLDDRGETLSSKQFEHGTLWSGATNKMAWAYVLGGPEGGYGVNGNELAAPARLTDLSGLPPTFIDVGECEVFRDEAVDYASQLWKCGVSAELHVWPGAYHGSDLMVPTAPVSRSSVAAKDNWVARLFGNF